MIHFASPTTNFAVFIHLFASSIHDSGSGSHFISGVDFCMIGFIKAKTSTVAVAMDPVGGALDHVGRSKVVHGFLIIDFHTNQQPYSSVSPTPESIHAANNRKTKGTRVHHSSERSSIVRYANSTHNCCSKLQFASSVTAISFLLFVMQPGPMWSSCEYGIKTDFRSMAIEGTGACIVENYTNKNFLICSLHTSKYLLTAMPKDLETTSTVHNLEWFEWKKPSKWQGRRDSAVLFDWGGVDAVADGGGACQTFFISSQLLFPIISLFLIQLHVPYMQSSRRLSWFVVAWYHNYLLQLLQALLFSFKPSP